jgi:hypothetical protein
MCVSVVTFMRPAEGPLCNIGTVSDQPADAADFNADTNNRRTDPSIDPLNS